jgi:hypothetical protein
MMGTYSPEKCRGKKINALRSKLALFTRLYRDARATKRKIAREW